MSKKIPKHGWLDPMREAPATAAATTFVRRAGDEEEEARIRAAAIAPTGYAQYGASLTLVTVMSGMGGAEFSVVVPSLWKYVQRLSPAEDLLFSPINVQILAMVLFYLGTTFSKPTLGHLVDRGLSFRAAFYTTTGCGALGGLLYALAGTVPSVGLLLLARFIGGTGNAISTMANIYAVKALTDEREQRQALANFAAATLVGVFIGPSVVPLFASIDVRVGPLRFDDCTLPGWFLFAVFGGLALAQRAILVEPDRLDAKKAAGGGAGGIGAATTWRWWEALGLGLTYVLTFIFSVRSPSPSLCAGHTLKL